jgi:hypothetical protein
VTRTPSTAIAVLLGAAALAAPALGSPAQPSGTPPTPVGPTSGSGAGYSWNSFWAGPNVYPGVVASVFGAIWVPDSRTGGVVSVLDATSGALVSNYAVPGLPPASAALQAGNYLWIAGQIGGRTVVTALDQTATIRLTFKASVKSANLIGKAGQMDYGGIGLAYGAGRVWVSDQGAGRLYGLSPTTAKLQRTIRVPAPRSVAVGGGRLWVTSTSSTSVKVFNPANGKQAGSIKVKGDTYVMAPAGGSMWVFQKDIAAAYAFASLKRTAQISIAAYPEGGWAGAVATPAGIWVSNYVVQAMLINPVSATIVIPDANAWSNDIGGGITAVGSTAWVANGSAYGFPLGSSVTRLTPTAAG